MKRLFSDIADTSAGRNGTILPRRAPRYSDRYFDASCDGISWPGNRSCIQEHKCKPCVNGGQRCCPESLLDLSAKICAANTPFQLVEERCTRVPGPVMQKFIYWSFPRYENDIRRYSALSCDDSTPPTNASMSQRPSEVTNSTQNTNSRVQPDVESRTTEEDTGPFSTFGVVTSSELDGMEVPFEQGVAMAESGKVKDVLQIDPQSCALCCLTLCENFPTAFHDTYRIIVDASNARRIDSPQLYHIARYLNQKGLRQRAFTIAYSATRNVTIAFNHDAHPITSDLLWAMQLAQSLGQSELTQMVSVVSRNVTCASVLSDVLRTCTSGVNSRDTTNIIHFGERSLRADNPILRPLLEAAISAYQLTIHAKLSHISPRHYTEFIDFLNKARETFLLSANGHVRFAELKENLKMVYKGKKKLLNLVALRFG